jgi:hypothetical protein
LIRGIQASKPPNFIPGGYPPDELSIVFSLPAMHHFSTNLRPCLLLLSLLILTALSSATQGEVRPAGSGLTFTGMAWVEVDHNVRTGCNRIPESIWKKGKQTKTMDSPGFIVLMGSKKASPAYPSLTAGRRFRN